MGLRSGIQRSKRHRIPDPDSQHCFIASLIIVSVSSSIPVITCVEIVGTYGMATKIHLSLDAAV